MHMEGSATCPLESLKDSMQIPLFLDHKKAALNLGIPNIGRIPPSFHTALFKSHNYRHYMYKKRQTSNEKVSGQKQGS